MKLVGLNGKPRKDGNTARENNVHAIMLFSGMREPLPLPWLGDVVYKLHELFQQTKVGRQPISLSSKLVTYPINCSALAIQGVTCASWKLTKSM